MCHNKSMESNKRGKAANKAANVKKKKRRGAPSGSRPAARAGASEKQKPRPKPNPKSKPQPKTTAPCPVFDRCGACQMLDVPYADQLARKQRQVEELFAGLVEPAAFRPILGMDDPYHYRNKVISPYAPGRRLPDASVQGRDRKGGKRAAAPRREVLTGMYAKGTHKLVPTDTCLLENETAKKVTLVVRDLMRKWNIEPYDEDAGTGFMRHAVVRVGHASGEVLVTLVTNSEEFPSSKSFCRELVRRVPAVTTVVQNVNLRQTNVILGETERVLFGPGFILDELCGLTFRISSHSFYQVNATQTEVLYNEAVSLAQLGGTACAIDAYCGTGTIGLVAASRGAQRVIGVDSVEAAIRDARQNAQHNGVANATFVCADATAFMEDLAAQRADRASGEIAASAVPDAPDDLVLLMDPPRAGSTERFLDAAARLAPRRIVYISCNPVTQVRDAAHLARAGYRIDAVQPVDMFPHTEHVECICRFVKEQGE